jgi:hypothetical protein
MLLFVGCNNDHTAPRDDQWRKYAEVEYSKYTKDSVYIAKGMHVTKGKYIENAKDGVYIAEGKYGKYAKEDASVEEGHNGLLPKKAMMNPLPRMATVLGTSMSPSPQEKLAT